jgi:hypothetical protein
MPSPIPPITLFPLGKHRCSTAKCHRAASYSLSGRFLCDACEAARIRRDLRITSAICLATVVVVFLACMTLVLTAANP